MHVQNTKKFIGLNMKKKVFITGTAGFIGFSLARKLIKLGHEVIGYDNLNEFYPKSVKEARLKNLEANDGYCHYDGDLCNYHRLVEIFAKHRPDIVCNFAAQAGVRYSLTNPFEYQKSNLEGFLNILECCRHHGVTRLVYASSSSVYGGNKSLPFSETDNVDAPISLYAASKKANELMAHCYSHLYNFQTIGLRFFTVYGPWGRPDMAMWIFTEKILNDKPIPVFNNGDMKRDFTYIDDIINGVTNALFLKCLDQYELFNLGNHKCENLLDMITLIEKSLNKKAIINNLPMQPGDVPATYADIRRSQEKLDFSPETSIAEGVPKFCKWYIENEELARDVFSWRGEEL